VERQTTEAGRLTEDRPYRRRRFLPRRRPVGRPAFGELGFKHPRDRLARRGKHTKRRAVFVRVLRENQPRDAAAVRPLAATRGGDRVLRRASQRSCFEVRLVFPKSHHCLLPLFDYLLLTTCITSRLFAHTVHSRLTIFFYFTKRFKRTRADRVDVRSALGAFIGSFGDVKKFRKFQ
jgi:hypothetical protein